MGANKRGQITTVHQHLFSNSRCFVFWAVGVMQMTDWVENIFQKIKMFVPDLFSWKNQPANKDTTPLCWFGFCYLMNVCSHLVVVLRSCPCVGPLNSWILRWQTSCNSHNKVQMMWLMCNMHEMKGRNVHQLSLRVFICVTCFCIGSPHLWNITSSPTYCLMMCQVQLLNC